MKLFHAQNAAMACGFLMGLIAMMVNVPAVSAAAESEVTITNAFVRPAQLIHATRPLVIGHRGFSKLAPENTLPSFRLALGARADLVELDYHFTRDKVMQVIHDYSVDRTTDALKLWGGTNIAMSAHTAAELATLDAGAWRDTAYAGTRLPTLAQAMDTIQAGGITLIERKAGDAPTLLAFLRERQQIDQVVVQSFDWKFIEQCREGDAQLVLGALGPPSTFHGRKLADNEKALNADFIAEIKKIGANVVVWSSAVDKASVAVAHQQGLPVWVYTIDDPAKAKELITLGVDGIITNDPETIRKAIVPTSESGLPKSARAIPQPLETHPGNICVEGENIKITPPEAAITNHAVQYRLIDVYGGVHPVIDLSKSPNFVGDERQRSNKLTFIFGDIDPGWYRIDYLNDKNEVVAWTSVAKLVRLKAPTPLDSPICLDTALAWFARNSPSNQQIHANLAALAGANWTRDRLNWGEVETAPGEFAPRGNYDEAAAIQNKAGLQVLQVFHNTPKWAAGEDGNTSHMAADLRSIYGFAKEMGKRFDGTVQAWEPWNEGNIKDFGGHTMDELCSWQKAAWLGFQASGRKPLVGWNVLAGVSTRQQAESVIYNEAYPYFDTYNIHTYDWAHGYREYWGPARVAAGGKPLWITEADRGAKHIQNAPWNDLPLELERRKAEYIGQSFASALAAGADRFYQFILGNYSEANGVQFGLLRLDYTPRPAYVAFAAAGRFLAGAKHLGTWRPATNVQVVAFQAWPDGVESDVLVAWTETEADWDGRGKATANLPWPAALKPQAVYNFVGRQIGDEDAAKVTSAPRYIVLPRGHASVLPLEPPVRRAPERANVASPLVLQAIFPPAVRVAVEDTPWSGSYFYELKPGEKTAFTLAAYNFTVDPVALTAMVEKLPVGWTLSQTNWQWQIDSIGRATATVEISCAENATPDGWIILRGRGEKQPDAALALRVKVKQK